jgi:hypothetical protein
MDIELVDPALRNATQRLPVPAVDNAFMRGVIRVAEKLMRVPKTDGVTVRTVRRGSAGLRLYQPEQGGSGAGLLWIHGGGFVIGDARQDEALCAGTAAELGIVVVSANYRLAPRHPFPAALDDLTAAWQWFQRHAPQLGVRARPIASICCWPPLSAPASRPRISPSTGNSSKISSSMCLVSAFHLRAYAPSSRFFSTDSPAKMCLPSGT